MTSEPINLATARTQRFLEARAPSLPRRNDFAFRAGVAMQVGATAVALELRVHFIEGAIEALNLARREGKIAADAAAEIVARIAKESGR